MSVQEHREIARFYDEIYYRDARQTSPPSPHLVRLANRLGITAGQKILDVACGTGNWLAAAEQRDAEISGIDISDKAIEVCRHRLPNGTFHTGVAETLPFDSNAFDFVTCLGSLEHFLDQPAALKEMARVAKPDARLLILVPNAGFPTYRLRLYTGTHQQAVQETIRSLDEWRRMFAEAGIEVVDRWKDLHVLSRSWVMRKPVHMVPLRCLQAAALTVWPLGWQYQVYHLCRLSRNSPLF